MTASNLFFSRAWQSIKSFFTAESHPLNLAVFRMALFGAIFKGVQLRQLVSFSRMPPGLKFAPWGMGLLLPHLPICPGSVTFASALLLAFSAMGFVGLFSRTSALACAVIGFYAFGIPNFYGKVDHNQHLIWFAAILAVSPCGDFLSLDAIVALSRRAGRGIRNPPGPSRIYALPLRFVMLLTAIIYFFPGFWKMWQSGFDWFLTDNLRRQLHLYWTWSFNSLWLPAYRIDQHFLLCKMAAAATVFFELTFIFLIFSRRFRIVPVLEGLAFHAATDRFMKIGFASLRVCYVAFVDWAKICAFVGRMFFRERIRFTCDETRPSSRLIAGFLEACDVFQRVTCVRTGEREIDAGRRSESSAGRRRPLAGVAAVGSFLLLGTVLAGMGRRINAWPFACYPTFSLPPPEQIVSLGVVAVAPSGDEREVRTFDLSEHRLYGLSRNILAIEDPRLRNDRLLLLWKRAVQTAPELRLTKSVKFYARNLWIDPDRWPLNPNGKTLLFSWNPPPGGGVPEPSTNTPLKCTEWQ